MLKEQNEGTKFFATSMERKWRKLGCLNESNDLIIEKLKEVFKEGLLSTVVFSSAISKNALPPSIAEF